jgi:hypothetical protein
MSPKIHDPKADAPRKGKRGRKPHSPTKAQRKKAKELAIVGVPHHLMAKIMRMDTKTLLKYYDRELELGKFEANGEIGGKLYRMAKSGNTAAAIFWMKAQAGWRDRVDIESGGLPLGVISQKPLTPDEWDAKYGGRKVA